MVAITKIVLLATGAAALVTPRDFTTVQNDLKTINSDTVALTNDVNSYTGGTINALPVANAESKLSNDIKSATTDVGNTASITAAQAGTILSYISGTLTPNVKKALNALVAKKSQFASAGLTSTVQGDLNSLHTETNSLSGALIQKAPSASKAAASKASSSINSLFTSAIAAYA